MKPEQLLRAILPSVIVDNFDIDRFEKTDTYGAQNEAFDVEVGRF